MRSNQPLVPSPPRFGQVLSYGVVGYLHIDEVIT
uniref:Uncharacterized protein n=1 Tax=Talaromyces marneffei PM1 TaxID=1077442 RepID=A0A093VAY2_TALMA